MEKVTIEVSMDEDVAEALAQFVKRVGWSEWRECAASDDEAYKMKAGCMAIQKALRVVGLAPR